MHMHSGMCRQAVQACSLRLTGTLEAATLNASFPALLLRLDASQASLGCWGIAKPVAATTLVGFAFISFRRLVGLCPGAFSWHSKVVTDAAANYRKA